MVIVTIIILSHLAPNPATVQKHALAKHMAEGSFSATGQHPTIDTWPSLDIAWDDAVEAADRLLSSAAFAVTLAYCVSLPDKRNGCMGRPLSPLQWDRTTWSHLNFFQHVGVVLDPGKWMLYFAWLLLVARANACANSQTCCICTRCQARGVTRQNLAQLGISDTLVRRAFVIAQLQTPCLQLDHQYSNRQVECAGDILEAVGGILHPWQHEAMTARKHLAKRGFANDVFDDARDWLGSLAQKCQWRVLYSKTDNC